MPSAYSAENNVALVATCTACQKSVPTALMVNLTGSHNSRQTHSAVSSPAQAKVGVRQVSLEFISGGSADSRWCLIIVVLKTI
jgi:hypothetical protein